MGDNIIVSPTVSSIPTRESVNPNTTSIPTTTTTPSSAQTSKPENEVTSATVEGEIEVNDNKSNLKSKYWDHFQRFKQDEEWKAKCNHCNKVLCANPTNGTKSLKNHVLNHCKRVKLSSGKQSTLSECFGKKMKAGDSTSFDSEYARSCISRAIVLHEYPLSIVDHKGMRDIFFALNPVFKCPSRNTIKKDILQLYEEEKLKAAKLFDQNASRVAITSDMWTSNQKKGYMVVTAHYIDSSWNLQSRILSFTYVPAPHTSEVLTNLLMKILLEWNLDRKLSTITLDNCSTNDAMIDELMGRLDAPYLMLGGKLLHMRCCAHILNLIVKDGIEIVKESVEKIRGSASYWSSTPKRHETFVAWCNKSGVPFTKKLVLDCPTRWNSTFVMLETALLYKDVFPRLRQKDPLYKSVPSNEEWELAKNICDRLKIFYDVTQLFSGTQYPTANMYFRKICEIKLALSKWVASTNPLISQMACNMMAKFEKYWDDVHGIMGVAAILDPRYKMNLLEYYFSKLYPFDYSRHVEKNKRLCHDLVAEYERKNLSSSTAHDISSQELSGVEEEDDGYDLFLKRQKKEKGPHMKTELDRYIEEDVLPRSPDFDILVWWKINGVKYPTLQQIARDVYAIPVSTVASESAFSTSGRVISTHRAKLKESTIEALMCTQNWLWSSLEGNGRKPITLDSIPTINEDYDEDEVEESDQQMA